ncbi:MAG: TolC family protein [bacterium]|nr:TolC family protein [bacterium]
MRKCVILLLTSLYGPFCVYSAPLTFQDCLNKSLVQNPGLQKAQKSLKEAVAKCYQGYANFLPTFSLGGQLVHLNDTPPSINFSSLMKPNSTPPRLAGNPLLQYAFQDNYTAYFRINEQLFTGGRNWALLNSYKAEYRSKKAEYRKLESQMLVDVSKTFYSIIIAKELKTLSLQAVKQLQRHLDSVRQSFKAGGSTEYDVLKTEVQLLSWTAKSTKAEKDLINAYNRLGLLLGISLNTNVLISGELTEPGTDRTVSLSIEQAREKALKNRPEIETFQAIKEINRNMKNTKIANALPQINLQYNYYYQNLDDEFTFKRTSWEKWWDVRLSFSWEFFSFGKRFAEIKENIYKTEGAEIDVKSLEDRIVTEVEDAYQNLAACGQDIAAAKKNLRLAELSLQMARDKNRTGTVTEIEVLDSEVTLVDARVQYLRSLYDHAIALAEFDRITGE